MNVEEWLGKDNVLGIDIWNKKYRYDNESFDQWLDRVSGGREDLKNLIKERKFLFGGRTLSNRGTGNKGSFFNCYSSGYAPDNYDGLLELNKNIGLTYKAQGGQGISLSKLRPKGAPIGTRYKSDGIVPFMEIFNTTTEQTSQGGARKGALMLSLDIRHKEAETFIKIKSELGKIEKANLSLEIDDEFMKAVDTYYKTGEKITFHEVRDYSGHKIEYDIVPIDLYKMMVKNCYDWADPACIFTERFRNYNLMEFDDEYQIETCNPCGEQPLPKGFSCNLGSLNLNEFVSNPYTNVASFNFSEFGKAIKIAITALDDIIDENALNHPLKEQRENSLNYRNIGLGIMGFSNCLMKLGLRYGSKESKEFTDTLFDFLFKQSILHSNLLASQKGAFPKYKDVILDSEIFKKHHINIVSSGLRNCSLISIAPTGSIGTMLGVSGGCEPEFALKYNRKTESLNDGEEKTYTIYCNSIKEYCKINNKNLEDELPDYFVSSADIPWQDRVAVQAIMQEHIDTAISSTVNLPENTTVEEVEQLYLQAWKSGIKGITIFRSGCKRCGILTTETKNGEVNESESEGTEMENLPWGTIIDVPEGLTYRKYKLSTGCGTLYFFLGFDEYDGRIYDCFTNTDGVGGCTVNTQSNSRLLSLLLRSGVSIEKIIQQLNKSGTCPSFQYQRGAGKKLSSGKSCPSAIANILKDVLKEMQDDESEEIPAKKKIAKISQVIEEKHGAKLISTMNKNACPECGAELTNESGCVLCKECGFSRC